MKWRHYVSNASTTGWPGVEIMVRHVVTTSDIENILCHWAVRVHPEGTPLPTLRASAIMKMVREYLYESGSGDTYWSDHVTDTYADELAAWARTQVTTAWPNPLGA